MHTAHRCSGSGVGKKPCAPRSQERSTKPRELRSWSLDAGKNSRVLMGLETGTMFETAVVT